MKKIISLITAAVLSIVLIAAAGIRISAAADDISFSAEIFCGDEQDVDGLSVELCIRSDEDLFWSAVYSVGSDEACEAAFEYAADGQSEYASDAQDGYRFEIELCAPVGIGFTGNFTLADLRYELPWEMVSEAVDAAGEGETYTLVADMDDYYEYFPLCVSMTYDEETDEEDTVWLYDDEDATYEIINEYFKIPVTEDFEVEIEVEKDEEGNVIALGVVKTGTDASPMSVYADAGTCGYLAFEGEEEDLDYSRLEGGFGIYRISYDMTELYEDEDGDPSRDISISGIEPVFSLSGMGIEVLSLVYSEGADELLVLGKKDGDLTVISVDASDGTLLEEITVVSNAGFEELYGYWEIPDGMVFQISSGLIAITADEQTGESSSLYVPLDEEELFSYLDSAEKMSFLYGGDYLAYAYTDMDDRNTDFYLMVFGSEGVVYYSCVSCSIDTGYGGVYTGESEITVLSLTGSIPRAGQRLC